MEQAVFSTQISNYYISGFEHKLSYHFAMWASWRLGSTVTFAGTGETLFELLHVIMITASKLHSVLLVSISIHDLLCKIIP